MGMLDLSIVSGAIVEMSVEGVWDRVKRRPTVIKLLEKFGLKPDPPPSDFNGAYAYAFVEFGAGRSKPVLDFFCHPAIIGAFRQAFEERDSSILQNEAESLLEWSDIGKQFRRLDYDPRREFAEFAAVFDRVVDRARTPAEVKQDHRLEDIHDEVQQIVESLRGLPTLEEIRGRLAQLGSVDQSLRFEQSIARDVRRLSDKTLLVLDGINCRLGDDLFLTRGDVDRDFQDKLASERMVILKGIAGAGKSAYAKSAALRLQESEYSVLAFRADSFAKETIEQALPYLENDLRDILTQMGQARQRIVLIDGLEKLLEVDHYEALRDFLRICTRFSNVRILATCRSFAYQQLVFELHYDFPKYGFVDVPVFNDQELAQVAARFPFLVGLLGREDFKEILRRPFYLNLVILHAELLAGGGVVSERAFRKLVWDKVISKHDPSRGSVFESIALQRAITMRPYARVENADPCAVRHLYDDGIILIEEGLKEAYSPSHDIYEDIALIRFVERVYQEKEDTLDFFERLGKEPAKRRAVRLWLNDRLVEETRSLAIFISEVLENPKVEQFWRDEVLIAVLRSDSCQKFFDRNQGLLSQSGHRLLLRCIHLLRTTCQEPDERLMQELQHGDQGRHYQWLHLRPVGPGWPVLLSYIHSHLAELHAHGRLILGLVAKDWSKKLRRDAPLPSEGRLAGMILLGILDEAKKEYSFSKRPVYSMEDVNEAIRTLFMLCSVIPGEIHALIEAADAFDVRRTREYRLADFHKAIVECCLSGVYSGEVCRIHPDLVCALALKDWLRHEPDEDGYSHALDIEDDFGLTTRTGFNYFPAGIYKTPTRFLLHYHPAQALRLVASALNHASDAYAKSERGKRGAVVEVRVQHEDGSVTVQKGNPVLWGMYRGAVEATPYLLQSMLMSLEDWLLRLCEIGTESASQVIEFAFSYLLKNTSTVATTAVLASIALAYPKVIGGLCFPILRVRDFYAWDLRRLVGDQLPLAPLDREIPFAQAERHKSNQLPHRKYNLENLVTSVQAGGYAEEIAQILDAFLGAVQEADIPWRLALSRMDFRKYEVDTSIELPEKHQVALTPKIDKDLTDAVEESQRDMSLLNQALGVINWARKVYEGQAEIEASPERWQQEYHSYQEAAVTSGGSLELLADPTYLAAVGVKVFLSQLTTEQLDWCLGAILGVLAQRIARNAEGDYFVPATPYCDVAIQVAPLVLSLELDEERIGEAKEIVFLSLLHLATREMEYTFASTRDNLWGVDEAFAESCLAGILEYAKLHKQKAYLLADGPRANERRAEFFEQQGKIAHRVRDNEAKLDVESVSFETHSPWYLGFAAQTIPLGTKRKAHRLFIERVLQLLVESFKGQIGDPSEYLATRQGFGRYVSEFLLHQPRSVSRQMFSNILAQGFSKDEERSVREARKFVEEIVEQVIVEEDKMHSGNLWHLWRVLESRIRAADEPYLMRYLFLSLPWWNPEAEDWAPLKGQRHYLRRLIIGLGHRDIGSVVKLLAGIGSEALLPEGLAWLKTALGNTAEPSQELSDSTVFFYCEKLLLRVYERHLRDIRESDQLRQSYLYLLDLMVNLGSSLGFIIRERTVSIARSPPCPSSEAAKDSVSARRGRGSSPAGSG